MFSVRARVTAFAPLVALTLLVAGAAVVGYRTDGSVSELTATSTPGPTPTASTAEPSPFIPMSTIVPVLPTTAPGTIGQARRSWEGAIDKLVSAASGRYSWAVYYDSGPDPLQRETGAFDLDPLRSRFDRTIPLRDGKKEVVHVRRIAETTYMQFDNWGSWSGCWLRVSNQQMEQATGVDFSGSLPLPVSVLAISDATITRPTGLWFGAPYREYGAQMNAAAALQFLGFSPQVVQKALARLVKIQVPVTVSLDAQGRIHGGGARGSEVAAAIARVAPNLLTDAVKRLPRYQAAFAVKGLGASVSVPAPSPKSILPFNARRSESCEAQGPRA